MTDQPPRINPDLGHSEKNKIIIQTDGTSTSAVIVQTGAGMFGEDHVSGYGVSRRRKGDRRSDAIGTSLAVGRAFRDAADRIEEALRKQGYTL